MNPAQLSGTSVPSLPSRKRFYRGDKRRFVTRILDVAIIALTGYFCAKPLVHGNTHGLLPLVYRFVILFCSFYAFTVFDYFRLYESWRGRSVAAMSMQAVGAWLSAWLAGIFATFLVHQSGSISRAWMLSWLVSASVLLVLDRVAIYCALRVIRGRGFNTKTVFIVGYGRHGQEFHQKAKQTPTMGYDVIGYFTRDVSRTQSEIPRVDKIEDIRAFVIDRDVDEVWLTLPLTAYADMEHVVAELRGAPVEIRWIPDASTASFLTHRSGETFGQLAIDLNHMPAPGVQGFLKEVFDRTCAAALLIASSPIMLCIALAVRFSSPGPVFYGHTRIGANGTRFKVYKFRSMVMDSQRILEELLASDPQARAEWAADHKLKNDPRITGIGRLLRATSLDELPQLYNVIRGEMSLVGPRPIVDDEVSKYGSAIQYYYAARPGMTGLWQVSGRNDVTYTSRVRLDCRYVLNWSLWQDLKILLQTVGVVFGRRGAY
jgi:putative colanic acid biosynthesis UDP-glucose lipid carrier transferase